MKTPVNILFMIYVFMAVMSGYSSALNESQSASNNVEEISANTVFVSPDTELEMLPEAEYIAEMQLPTINTVSVFNASGRGLLRGGANLITCPGELVRGFTYEYSARKWYVAAGTSFLAALGGTGARLCAGAGDIITLGAFGDMDLAKGFPDYVWEGAWVYKPPMAISTKSTSNTSVPAVQPEKDILPGENARVIKARAQENTDFYESRLPEGTGL